MKNQQQPAAIPPVGPGSVPVDRSLEDRLIVQINARICEPWGPEECLRLVDIQTTPSVSYYLKDLYTAAGWRVSTHLTNQAPDKWQGMRFERPGSPVFTK